MFFRGISTLSTSSGDKKALIATGLRLLAIRDDRNHFVRPGSRVDQICQISRLLPSVLVGRGAHVDAPDAVCRFPRAPRDQFGFRSGSAGPEG